MKTYLGDGLYAEFDGWQYRLYASDGINVTNEVFLDRYVLDAFMEFIAKVNAFMDAKSKEEMKK